MTPTAKQPEQSSAAKITLNAEISFRRRISSRVKQTISACRLALLAITTSLISAPRAAYWFSTESSGGIAATHSASR
jgi:hypothetical protein